MRVRARIQHSKTQRDGECLLWTGSTSHDGYGVTKVKGKQWRVHRLAWTEENGDIPAGKMVCHTCDRRTCVNPAHLFLGVAKDNHDDMKRKGRGVSGERNGRAKLNRTEVDAIRVAYANGEGSYRKLASRFGASPSQVAFIVTRRTWREGASQDRTQ